MLGGLGVLIGEIAGVIAIVSVSVAGYRWWRNRHKVLWVNKPMPPEKLPKIQARRVHLHFPRSRVARQASRASLGPSK